MDSEDLFSKNGSHSDKVNVFNGEVITIPVVENDEQCNAIFSYDCSNLNSETGSISLSDKKADNHFSMKNDEIEFSSTQKAGINIDEDKTNESENHLKLVQIHSNNDESMMKPFDCIITIAPDSMFFKTIEIERDYSKGLITRFNETFPKDLQNYIDEKAFEQVICEINSHMYEMELTRKYDFLIVIFSFIFLWIPIRIFSRFRYKSLDDLSLFIAKKNEQFFSPVGLEMVHPIVTGFQVIIIRPSL